MQNDTSKQYRYAVQLLQRLEKANAQKSYRRELLSF